VESLKEPDRTKILMCIFEDRIKKNLIVAARKIVLKLIEPQRTSAYKSILEHEVSEGKFDEAVTISKELGRSLTQDELRIILVKNIEKLEFHKCTFITKFIDGPDRDYLRGLMLLLN
jgi:hypothetical protein